MTAALYAIGRGCARHRRLVLILWLAAVVGLGLLAGKLGTETNDNPSLPGTDSQRAGDLIRAAFSADAVNGSNPIVLRAPDGSRLTDAPQREAIEQIAKHYQADPAVAGVISPLEPAGAAQISRDGRIAYLSLTLHDGPTELTVPAAEQLLEIAQDGARESGITVAAGGYLGADLSQPESADSDAIGLLAAVVVLLFTFGTVVAMGLPILTAILGLAAGLSLITLASHVVQVPSTAPALATMIGLGVGIDYALFVVTRHRQHLAEGLSVEESAARAVATAGGAVVFAGGTVVIALCSLLLTGIPLVQQMGVLAGIAVIVAVIAAITLLPAALALVGRRIDSLKLPGLKVQTDPDHHPTVWLRWARFVADRPWPTLAASLVVLAAITWPLTTLDLGQSDTGQLPRDTTARQAYDLLGEGFGAGTNGPLLIAVEDAAGADPQQALVTGAKLAEAIRANPGVAAVSPPIPAPRGDALLLTVTPKSAPSDPSTERLVRDLRATTIPTALTGTGAQAFVGGATASFIDLSDEIADRLPLVIAIVLALSFVLLTIAFRSLVVPVKAVVMNLLSIGAAFGVVSYVFSNDWTAQLLGVEGAAPIVSFVPLMMFAILFGLSMDYEVFLMTRVRERWQVTGDAHRSVIEGLAGTARVITSAALIMISVFLAFLLNGNPTIKQFGLGMAAAVAIDATVIRCLVVPAVLSLLGRHAWWMPEKIDRFLPHFSIEGDEWFAARDRAAAAAAAGSGDDRAPTPADRDPRPPAIA